MRDAALRRLLPRLLCVGLMLVLLFPPATLLWLNTSPDPVTRSLVEQLNQRFPELRARMGDDGMLAVDAIADAYWALHTQHRSAWTLELDLRPYKEKF